MGNWKLRNYLELPVLSLDYKWASCPSSHLVDRIITHMNWPTSHQQWQNSSQLHPRSQPANHIKSSAARVTHLLFPWRFMPDLTLVFHPLCPKCGLTHFVKKTTQFSYEKCHSITRLCASESPVGNTFCHQNERRNNRHILSEAVSASGPSYFYFKCL